MAISARTYDGQQGTAGRRIILEACPCGYEFDRGEALETLLTSNFEPVETGIRAATEQAQNQQESASEEGSA